MKSLVVLIVASTFWTGIAAAQSTRRGGVFGRYQQLTWQERDGLPQNTVLAVATTLDGYLWLGTFEGAVRFDGVRFTRFNPATTNGIGDSWVNSLVARRDGDLWLGTYGGGVSRVSRGRFTQYGKRDGLSSDFALCLFEDRGGTLWIGTDGGGVDAFSGGRFTPFTTANGLPSNLVRSIVDDEHGGLLLGTNGGIARIANGRVSAYEGPASIAHGDITVLSRATDGSLWVAAASGLYRVDSHDVTEFGPGHGWPNDRVASLFADEDGRMWIGTSRQGLFVYTAGRFEHYTQADGLPGAGVPVIARGVDNGLWIGTDGGLLRLKEPRFTIYTQRDGLGTDFTASMFQDAEGSVWVETGDALTRFANGAFKVLTASDGLPGGRSRRLSIGADRFPLVQTTSGLARWRHDRLVPTNEIPGIPWDRLHDILEDRSGTLWFAVHDGGLIRVRDGRSTHYGTKDGLADDTPLTLFEDRHGSIWVGTLQNGITRITNGQMTSWSTRDGAPRFVKVFHEDSAGTLWIGTNGAGLSRFKDGKLATISARQGLYNDDISQILEDDDGNLWMNCNTGIWRTSLKQLNEVADGRRTTVDSFAYGVADGMLSSEGVGASIAGWKMRDGSLWFPTTKGIVAIDPRRRDTEPPRVVIAGITLDGQPAAIGEPVRLRPGQENLEIQYTALSWSRPQAIRFRFLLVGLDRDWVEAGARRTAYYSHLPPGSYTFTVTADNGEGVWNPHGETLAVVVLPRLYQTWWFRAAIASSLVVLVWVSWRYRIGQLRQAQAAQQAFSRQLIESQERERQRIAAELHDSLGQNLLVVKNRAMLGAMSHQEARDQFDEIGATVAHTLDEVRAISYNLRPYHLDQLGLTTTIRAMIEKVAESSGIAISSELDDIDGTFAPADEITIYRIVQESLNNVVKHSQASEAHVEVRRHEDHVEITIRDNGQGFVSRASAARPAGGGGFGLKGLAERVQMLGGTHTIESSPGRGATVTVRIAAGGV